MPDNNENWDDPSRGTSTSSGPHSEFEILASRILLLVSRQENRTIIFQPGTRWGNFDAVVLEGLGNMEGPTVVEIKERVSHTQYLGLRDYLSTSAERVRARSILLIVRETPLREPSLNDRRAFNTDFSVWDISYLTDLARRYAEYVADILPELAIEAAASFEGTSFDQYSSETERDKQSHLKSLRLAYREKRLSLYLGAGVSYDPGIPNWDSLLTELMCKVVERKSSTLANLNDPEKHLVAERLRYHMDGSFLTQAGYAKASLQDDYYQAVVSTLWSNISHNRNRYHLINTICNLCKPIRKGVKSVITYNWYDLIEIRLAKIHRPYQTIMNEKALYGGQELPVYHVHGFIPQSVSNSSSSMPEPVFSEDTYHSLINDASHWANIVQLNALRENICLMVGLSMSDPNLRRLLDIMSRQPNIPKHYAILRMTSLGDFLSNPKPLNIQNTHGIQTLVAKHNRAIEIMLHRLGINVIWVQAYNEIDSLLGSIKN